MMPFVGVGIIKGVNFLHDKKEEKIRKVCDSLEAKIKEGITFEQISQNYFLETQEKISEIRNINLSKENTRYLNEIEQYLYKAQQSNDVKYQRSVLVDTFPNIYRIKEIEDGILFSTTILLGFSIILYGCYRLGKQIKRQYKKGNRIKQGSKNFKDELGDFDN